MTRVQTEGGVMSNLREIWRLYLAPTVAGASAVAAAASPLLTVTLLCLTLSGSCLYISVRRERGSRLIQTHHT